MEIRTRKNVLLQTRDRSARANGFLVPIFNVHDGFVAAEQHPQQAYLTVVAPGSAKGPHLHMKRWGLFTCIKGNVKIVVKVDGRYEEHLSGEDHEFTTIQLPPGLPAAIVNLGKEDAYVLNMPAPSWHVDDQDDHPVLGWDYPLP
jgi:dTDP-4-dehydrorhamnose 3,5-epimerase-like enzyme